MNMLPRNNLPAFDFSDENTFGDPLDGYCDGSSFNIIQFLADTDTPVDSPLERSQLQARQQQQHMHHQPPDPHHGNSGNAMYQNNGRLPDSPPITDISGPGSSASPHSSNSDSPYSPNDYANYGVIHGHNGNGLILAAGDLQNNLMVQQCDILQQPIPGMNSRMLPQHTLASPQGVNQYMQTYPASQPTPATMPQVELKAAQWEQKFQVSPQQNMNGNYFNGMEMYPNSGSDSSLHSQSGPSKKRPRVMPTPSSFGPQSVPGPMLSPMGEYGDENFQHSGEVIRFNRFQEELWQPLYDENHQQLKQLQVQVIADKGFNYSSNDQCFVNQKKNHFQITVNIEASDALPPRFVRVNGQLHAIKEFQLAFKGAKAEMLSSDIMIKQSQTDRRPIKHDPVPFKIAERRLTKVTVPRLHFAETTNNNMRKNSKPNPDQKYFLLLVQMNACTEDGQQVLVQAYQSERVIVRATNPGQFDQPDLDMNFQKNGEVMTYGGKMVIGGDKPIDKDAMLSVHGNLVVSGNMVRPSDERLKENIVPLNPDEVMERYQKYQIVTYNYKPEVARDWGLDEQNRSRAGMIAQQLKELYPEAVVHNGEFLTIDENRLLYDSMVVTKELVQLTQELDKKICDNVDELQKRIKFLMRKKQFLGSLSIASGITDATSGFGDTKSYMSMSTPSLVEPKEKRRSRKNAHCQNPSCHRNEPLCNNKLTQGTIVALVVIMAACLLAMSALYIVDWHNRNKHYNAVFPIPQSHLPKSITDTEIGTMIKNSELWVPSHQPGVTSLMPTCDQEHCQRYCCAEPSKYITTTENKVHKDDSEGVAHAHHYAQTYEKRSVRAYKADPDGVSVDILNLNITIDDSYCYGNNCNDRRNRYSYYIPVSAYMPTIPLQIRFNVPRGRFVNNCGYLVDFQEKPCYDSNPEGSSNKRLIPAVTQISDNTFEVTAGSFLQSAYRFRVGPTTEACYSLGIHEEYNLIFYRTCNAPIKSEGVAHHTEKV